MYVCAIDKSAVGYHCKIKSNGRFARGFSVNFSDSHSFIFPVRFRMCKKGPQKSRFKKRNLRQRSANYQGARPKAETRICEKAKKRAESSQWRLRRPKAFERRQRNPRQTFLSAFTKMTVTKWHIQKFGQQSLEKN